MTQKIHAQIIAHRGASKEAPENTISAITRAINLGVNYVEFDVHLSKEGIPVILHDPSAARMIRVNGSPPIRQLTLAQIQQFDVGQHFGEKFTGEKIPTLLEVLNLNWKDTGLMIEIKDYGVKPKILVQAILEDIVKVKNLLSQIMIGSFSYEILKEIQQSISLLNLPVKVIGIIEKPERIDSFTSIKMKHLALFYKLITPNFIQLLKEYQIEVWAFTVDDIEVAKFLLSIGVKGIISNSPKEMKEAHLFDLPISQ